MTAGPLVVQVMPVASVGSGPSGPASAGVRVGFAVGRPVGGAVVRNRVRRRLREAAGASLPVAAGRVPGETLVVVRARPGAESLGVPELATLLAQAWRRIEARRAPRS